MEPGTVKHDCLPQGPTVCRGYSVLALRPCQCVADLNRQDVWRRKLISTGTVKSRSFLAWSDSGSITSHLNATQESTTYFIHSL
jgi:hypothetical protein